MINWYRKMRFNKWVKQGRILTKKSSIVWEKGHYKKGN